MINRGRREVPVRSVLLRRRIVARHWPRRVRMVHDGRGRSGRGRRCRRAAAHWNRRRARRRTGRRRLTRAVELRQQLLLVVQLKLEQVLLVPQLLARGELGVRIDVGAYPRVRERSLDRTALVGVDLATAEQLCHASRNVIDMTLKRMA